MSYTTLDADLSRRRALWNAKCVCSGPFAYCRCIDACEGCGHVRAEHDHDGAPDAAPQWGGCEVPDCECGRFTDDDND